MAIGQNKRVELRIDKDSGIKTADGVAPSADISIVFYTEATPVYASVDYILLQGGDVIGTLPEAAIYLEIYAASTLVDDILLFDVDTKFPGQSSQAWSFFRRARQEFVTCKTIADLLKAIISSKATGSGRRTLADFTVDLGSQANLLSQARGYLTDVIDCYIHWRKVLYSGASADFDKLKPTSAVKSGTNVNEQSGIGRGWITGGPTLNSRESSYVRDNSTKNRPRRGYSRGINYYPF